MNARSHVMNLNFGWKDCPFAALRTSPLVWQAAWLTICFRVYGTSASSQGALVSRQGARERGLEASGGRGVGHAHAGLLFKFAETAAASSAAVMAAITASSVGAPVRRAATACRK